jgi:hypothetical protein
MNKYGWITHSLSIFIALASIAGCHSNPGSGSDMNASGAPTMWLGADPHLRVLGHINGEDVDINLTGAAAADTTQLWCEREYSFVVVGLDGGGGDGGTSNAHYDYTQGGNSEVRIRAVDNSHGMNRTISFDPKRINLQKATTGTTIPIVMRVDSQAPGAPTWAFPDQMWFHWKWYQAANPDAGVGDRDAGTPHPVGMTLYNMAAQQGSYFHGEFTGSVDATGAEITPYTGAVGGFATAQWSTTDQLAISFTANCTFNDIDDH